MLKFQYVTCQSCSGMGTKYSY